MKGDEQCRDVKCRGFGEVYKALDKRTGTYVAIKKTKLSTNETIQSKRALLMRCCSPFIVRYYGTVRKDNELWVIVGTSE